MRRYPRTITIIASGFAISVAVGALFGANSALGPKAVSDFITEHTIYGVTHDGTVFLAFQCSSQNLYVYNVDEKEIYTVVGDAPPYVAMRAEQLTRLLPSSYGEIFVAGASVFGLKSEWTRVSSGKATFLEKVQMLGAVILGFGAGFYIGYDALEVSCASPSLPNKLKEKTTWIELERLVFSTAYREIQEKCNGGKKSRRSEVPHDTFAAIEKAFSESKCRSLAAASVSDSGQAAYNTMRRERACQDEPTSLLKEPEASDLSDATAAKWIQLGRALHLDDDGGAIRPLSWQPTSQEFLFLRERTLQCVRGTSQALRLLMDKVDELEREQGWAWPSYEPSQSLNFDER